MELGGFDQNDINYYIWYNANIAQPSTSLYTIPIQIHGSDVGINSNSSEIELDIEMLEAITSGLDQIDVYEDGSSVEAELLTILNDDEANQISISWDASENAYGASNEPYYNSITELLALQGQEVFVASGDWGSSNWGAGGSGLDVNYYAASPWVTGVGGTTLGINESSNYGAFSWENVWNSVGYATGGGISQYTSLPGYQYNYLVNNSSSWGSPTSFSNRNIPDVALDADPATGYYTHILGIDRETGGTSACAPLWAAFWAQLNQLRQINNESKMGFGNPALYSIAEGGNYNSDFHDVYGGTNNGYYYPEYGYDCATGLGSIDGLNMINDLIYYGSWSPSESLYVSPGTVLSGQQVSLTAVFNPAPPTNGYAEVVYAQGINGVWYQLGVDYASGGATYDTFTLTAPDVKTPTQETYACYVIYYDYNGTQLGSATWSNAASTTVYPNTINGFSVSGPAYDGLNVTGTISLLSPAAQNETIALCSSDPANASVPANVTVPAGAADATFPISTKLVAASEQVTITANPANSGLGGSAITTQFTVAPLLASVKVSPASITGSLSGKGTITLLAPAPANGAVVSLHSSNSAASVPASITVPAGSTSASFTITTSAVSSAVSGKITATYGAAVKTTNLKVEPIGVSSLTLTPSTVVGGNSVSGKVTLAAPAAPGSITVSLSSNTPSVANPTAASLTIPAGSQTGTFTVKTNSVSATTLVTIKATANGITKSKTLKVTP